MFKGLLNPKNEVAFYGPDIWRHVQSSTRHEDSVDLVKTVLCIVNGEDDEDVDPVSPEKVNKRWKGYLCPRWFEHGQKDDAQSKSADHPGQVDALHSTHSIGGSWPLLHQGVVPLVETRAFSLPCAVNVGSSTVRITTESEVVNPFKSVNPTRTSLLPLKAEGIFPNRTNVRFLGG